MKSIAVFCAASENIAPGYFEAAAEVGAMLGRMGATLVYGGARFGLMEATAKAAKATGAHVVGVVPEILVERDRVSHLLDEHIPCRNLSERKDIMLEKSDILVALPGGVGTLDEIFHVMAAATIGYHSKRVVLYNVNGFWDGLTTVLGEMNGMGFVRGGIEKYLVDACRGEGKIIKNPCPNCRGTGLIRVNKKLEVSVPAGIDDGERIALRGQGNDGKNGGSAGDLIIQIMVKPHPIFEREGYNIYCEVPLPVTDAILGAEIEIPTLKEKMKYNIPEGTQPGTDFTVRGQGIPYVNNNNRRGDLIFRVNVEIPKGLSEEQKEQVRAFAGKCREKNYAKKSGFFKRIFEKLNGED